METGDNRSIADLLRELSREFSTFFRQEVALARTETAENLKRAGKDLAWIGAGALVALGGALALLFALNNGLTVILAEALGAEVATWLAPTILGVIVLLIGYLLIRKGLTALKHETFAPRKTTQSLEETKEWMKEKLT